MPYILIVEYIIYYILILYCNTFRGPLSFKQEELMSRRNHRSCYYVNFVFPERINFLLLYTNAAWLWPSLLRKMIFQCWAPSPQSDPRLTKLTHITLSSSYVLMYLCLYRTGIYRIRYKGGRGSDRKLGTVWRESRVSEFQNVPTTRRALERMRNSLELYTYMSRMCKVRACMRACICIYISICDVRGGKGREV